MDCIYVILHNKPFCLFVLQKCLLSQLRWTSCDCLTNTEKKQQALLWEIHTSIVCRQNLIFNAKVLPWRYYSTAHPCPMSLRKVLQAKTCTDELQQFPLLVLLCIKYLCCLNNVFPPSTQPSAVPIQSFNGKTLHIISHTFPRQQCDGINTV